MKIQAKYIRLLIEALAGREGVRTDYSSLVGLTITLEGKPPFDKQLLGDKVFYNPYNQAQKAGGVGEVAIAPAMADAMAIYLGFRNINDFIQHQEGREKHQRQQEEKKQRPDRLEGFLGDWYSVVRDNNRRSQQLIISPFTLQETDKGVCLTLTGRENRFHCMVNERYFEDSSRTWLMHLTSEIHKELMLCMHIGKARHPKVILGTFAGLNSADEPIAGREVLVRKELLETSLPTNFHPGISNRIPLAEAKASENHTLRRLGEYFRSFDDCNVASTRASSFDIHDLGVSN